jgi:DNA-binding MurR/RpiR family transcriptional regulator
MTTRETHEAVANYIRSHSDLTYWQIALNLGISTATLTTIAKEFGLGRTRTLKLKISE